MFESLQQQLKNKFGEFTPERLTGGYTNSTYLLKGTTPVKVAKMTDYISEDMLNEVKTLQFLRDSLMAPKLFDFFEVNDCFISIIEYREGVNGQELLEKQLSQIGDLFKKMGQTLAESVHSLPYNEHAGIRTSNIQSLNMQLDFVPQNLTEKSQKMVKGLDELKSDWVLTHGDYGVHNVLFSEEGKLTVLDWEWTEWGSPCLDLAWMLWFTNLHYKDKASELNTIFLNEYLKHNSITLDETKIKAYCVYKVWKVLNRVEHSPQEVKEEWIRRLKWTLETDLLPHRKLY